MILSVEKIYNDLKVELKDNIEKLNKSIRISLLRIGNNPGAISFEKSIIKEANDYGIEIETNIFDSSVNAEDIKRFITDKNQDEKISGILPLFPMEANFDSTVISQYLDYKKDLDGLTDKNISKLIMIKDNRDLKNISSTAVATFEFLKSIISIEGKDVLIINRSNIIGKPLMHLLINENATVTIGHSKSKDLESKMKNYDIVISAIGKAEYFKDIEFKEGAIVIDLGFSFIDGKYYGDFRKEDFENTNIKFLPSMGGIGKINANIILRNAYLNEVENDI